MGFGACGELMTHNMQRASCVTENAIHGVVRHPGLKLNMPPWVFCVSGCPDFEFQRIALRGGGRGTSLSYISRGVFV